MEPNFQQPIANQIGPKGNKKKILFLASGIFLLLCVFGLLFFQQTMVYHSVSSVQPSITGTKNVMPSTTKQTITTPYTHIYNPLINNQEVTNEQAAYHQIYIYQGANPPPVKEPKFHYTVSDQSKTSGFALPIAQTEAVSSCVGALPDTVNVYSLSADIGSGDAKNVAKTYGLSGSPESILMDDSKQYSYFFHGDNTFAAFLYVDQPSNETHYHLAPPLVPPAGYQPLDLVSVAALRDKHVLDSAAVYGTALPAATLGNGDGYMVTYQKLYDSYPMINDNTISNLGVTKPACSIQQALDTNTVTLTVSKQDGSLLKLEDLTRKIAGKASVKTISVTESIKEYGDSNPIPPIVIGGSLPDGSTLTPNLSDVAVVWYDYGSTYKQTAYVPMYLTTAVVGGVRVLTLFPTVSKDDLAKLPLLSSQRLNTQLQLQPYYPKPATSSTKTASGKCFGSQVDYSVNCTAGAQTTMPVCHLIFSLPVGTRNTGGDDTKTDPLNVCSDGVKSVTTVITAPGGTSVCNDFLKQNGIDLSQVKSVPGIPSGTIITSPAGSYSCQLQGRPC